MDDLDKKYQKNTENLDGNSDILTSYGTYLTSSNTFETNEPSMKRYLNVAKNNNNLSYSYNDKKYRNWINNNNESSNYNKIRLNQSIMKRNEIYDEYKRYTSNFNTNLNGNMNFRNNFEQQELINLQGNEVLNENMTINNKYRTFSKNNKNEMIGRNEGLYHSNIMELNKLSNYNLTSNDDENDNIENNQNIEINDNNENNEILITNYQNENFNKENTINNNHLVDLLIKYKLPSEEEDNNKVVHKIYNKN